MIAKLRGIVDSSGEDWLILDVSGVGYLLTCSTRTLAALPAAGEAASLTVETQMREDSLSLYGFAWPAERDWFRLLTGVQGVGAKVALAILSVLGPDQLTQAIAAADKSALCRASGVGPKLATRIANELKDKVGGLALGVAMQAVAAGNPVGAAGDAVSALVNLGYKRGDAFAAVTKAAKELGEDVSVQVLIRAGLKELAP